MTKVRRLGLTVTLLVSSCSMSQPATSFRPLGVRTNSFAMAEMVRRVGLSRVVVSDHAAIVIDVGRGSMPWIDPVAMKAVPAMVASLLSGHDPGGRSAYDAAARAYAAQLGAIAIDYRSSLADCGRHDLVTADTAFAPVAAHYDFVDHAAADTGTADLIRTKRIPVVFTETAVESATIDAVAAATHVRVDQLDTMVVRTPAEAARGATYLSLMIDNLAKLRTALACGSA